MVLLVSFLLVFFAFLVSISAGTDKLIAVVQIFRHGQRTPLSFYANDPYADLNTYFAGLGFGELTNEGNRQHYALGQKTRSRYSSFLPTAYNTSVLYAQTTDVDRTHMSAQSNLFGIFPASGTQVWKKGVTWQPIPIHPSDSQVVSGSSICSYESILTDEVFASDEFTSIDNEYAELYKYLSTNTGENITNVDDVNSIWDTLKIENDIGYSLPSWASSVFPYPLRNLSGYYIEGQTHTTQLKRLFTGPFLNEIVTYLENMATNSSYSQKFQIYSAHDTNIAAILNCFGAYNPPFPPQFASTMWIELRLKNWAYIVNVYYKDDDTITEISINGCNLDCPLAQVRERLSNYLIDVETRNAECEALISSTTTVS